MGRRPKTNRVPRTRASGEWTEAAFWNFIRSGLRQTSRRWPPRYDALKDARIPYEGEDKRRKWVYLCAICHEGFLSTEVNVDHIVPCGKLKSWIDMAVFSKKLFCEKDGLRVLCKSCHQIVTDKEKGKK